GKPFSKRYQLQKFGTGFIRLALETRSPVVPVAVIGHEETYPAIFHPKWIAKFLKAPYIPVTPFFPWLGPLGVVPLPSRIQIRYSDPIQWDHSPDVSDDVVEEMVEQVKTRLKREIQIGLRKRGGRIF